jgi:TRAP-type C4-dicarboxylate transport system permease small subunit
VGARAALAAGVIGLLVAAFAFYLLWEAARWSLKAMARDPLGWGAVAAAWVFAWLVVGATLALLALLALLFYVAELDRDP